MACAARPSLPRLPGARPMRVGTRCAANRAGALRRSPISSGRPAAPETRRRHRCGEAGSSRGAEAAHLLLELLHGAAVKVGLDPLLGVLGGALDLVRGVVVVCDVVDQVLERAPRVGLPLELRVLRSKALRLLDHARHILLGVARGRRRDRDRRLGVGRLVDGVHREDAVGVDVEGDDDLRLAPLGALEARDGELAQLVARVGRGALALKDADVDLRLPVLLCRERVRLAARDGGVALHDGRHDLARRLDAQRERHHVHQHERVAHLGQLPARRGQPAAKHARLHRGAVRDRLVGVNR
mmetsp:Transcript_9082/g.24155  ORF Transcript_9082/g.24155 Transcript_9082/m.24155 type:complete len:298 (-) Transcript_9082:804-1697(-)